jgi:hypothetical protein
MVYIIKLPVIRIYDWIIKQQQCCFLTQILLFAIAATDYPQSIEPTANFWIDPVAIATAAIPLIVKPGTTAQRAVFGTRIGEPSSAI